MPHNGYTGLSGEPRVISLGNFQHVATVEDCMEARASAERTNSSLSGIQHIVAALQAFQQPDKVDKYSVTCRGPYSECFSSATDTICSTEDEANHPRFKNINHFPNWHQDGPSGHSPRGDELGPWVMVWANVACTEILLSNGHVLQPPDGEAVVFDNYTCRHRCPLNVREFVDRRMFIRIFSFGRPIGGRVLA